MTDIILKTKRNYLLIGDSGAGKSSFYNCLSNHFGIGSMA